MSKASVERSPAKRASKNAVAEEPLLLEVTLQKSSPLQRETKRASANFEVFASNSKAPMKVAKGRQHCIVSYIEKKGGLERKINKFRADYGIVKLEASNCDVAVSSIPTILASKLEGRQVVEQPMYMQQVLSIAEGISKELDQQQEQLAKVEVQLQQKREVSLRNEGLSSAYSGLYTELEELKKELEHLKNSPDATPRDIDYSYDEDHSNRFDYFQMKGFASDDTANVLQGMTKVTTENSPILVLEEPSGKMDNASTLVEDKDKNSTMNPPINFSIDVPPVHKGEDHEKNTTLDPVSKVSIDSAEGTIGRIKLWILPTSSQLTTPKVRMLYPARLKLFKIRVVNYPSSKSLDDSDIPINIDRVPPVYRSLGRADVCNDASRPAIILDLNNVLMITHRKSRDPLPPNVSSLYFYIIKDQEDRDITYYVRADATLFILHASQLAKVFIWSSCTLTNLNRRIDRCFSQVKVCFSGWAGQEMCHHASWQMGEKPVFFKSLETFSKGMQGLGKYSTLLLDDSYYKNHLNEKGTYVVLPGNEQQSEEQWDGFLRNDVL
ncbi:hypothetical protein L7F22_000936 [Adiantum nelumboides]|nr:hypothetical protein [Adiantum nelumboides]